MINLGYFGSPDFSADFLEKLIKSNLVNIKTVFTQPDRPAGRKQILTPTPVKKIALKYNIPVVSLINQKRSEEIRKIRNQKNSDRSDISDSSDLSNIRLTPISSDYSDLSGIDLALVYAFSAIIPKELLDLPKYGFWCIHPSLLPKYRGSSPIATTLINGDKQTGVTIFKMDKKIDHGPIITQEKCQILPTDKRPDLEKKLTDLAFQMFKKIIINNDLNNLKPTNQDDNQATYTKKLTKQDGFIDFQKLKNLLKSATNRQSLVAFYNLYRGFYPWPGIWTILPNGKRLKITEITIKNDKLKIEKVQLEGKKEVDFENFNQSYNF